MQAAFIERTGPPEVIQYGQFPDPTVGPSDVLVRVSAVAVNRIDTHIRSGRYDARVPFPFVIGRDMVGVVEQTGSGVTEFAVGDRVWSNCLGIHGRQGAFAERLSVPIDCLFALPDGVDERLAVAALHSGLTAIVGLQRKAQLRAGETIFVNGGSGNVGQAVINLSKAMGATVIATAGSLAKAEACRAQGADAVILYKQSDLLAELRSLAPQGVHVWWEATPRPDWQQALNGLASEGRLVLVSGLGTQTSFELGSFYTRNLTAYGFAVTNLHSDVIQDAAAEINAALAAGTLRPEIAQVLPLSAARQAHEMLEANSVEGKLVLVPEEAADFGPSL